MLSVVEKIALTALVLGVPIEDIELRIVDLLGCVGASVKASKSSCVEPSLCICVHAVVESRQSKGDQIEEWKSIRRVFTGSNSSGPNIL
jgi:hypothetical protein